jgi:hypothetical protein
MSTDEPLDFPFPEQLPDGDDDDGAEGGEAPADDMVTAALDDDTQQRLWVRAIILVLQLRSQDMDPSPRVQLAQDLMHIAACERIARLMRADLPPERA